MKPAKGRSASERHIKKIRLSPAARPSTPPVYRTQPTPKVSQRKVRTIAPAQLPVTQSKVRPGPPKVLQATTIQRAADNKWATTAVASFKRSKNKIEKGTGYSGSGKETGRLLSQIGTEAAEKVLRILRCAGTLEHKNRSGFTCAEPNAVAQLLAKPNGPKTVAELLKVKVVASDSVGRPKVECLVCRSWIHLDSTILDITQPAGVAVNDEGQEPAGRNWAEFLRGLPAAPPAPAPAAPPGPAAAPTQPRPAPWSANDRKDWGRVFAASAKKN